jgi:predicted Zn-dependent peptidase
MCLAVAGNVEPEQVIEVCDRMLTKAEPVEIERSFETEPREIVDNYCEYNLAMSMPVFSFGYKEDCKNLVQDIRKIIEVTILLEILAGQTSKLYTDMFEKGLINTTFSKEYFIGYGYEAVIFDGESSNPQAVADEIKKAVKSLKENGIDDNSFETARRSLYGREIMEYNDIDSIANGLVNAHFNGYSVFDSLEIYKSVTKEDIENRLADMMKEEYSALSIVKEK